MSAMVTAQSAYGTFPPSLDQVSPSEQVVERFGWLPGYFGALATAGAIYATFSGWWGDKNVMSIPAVLTLSGPLALWWEFHRRKGRTVLVLHGAEVGVYRWGQFVRAIGADEMLVRQLSRFNTFRLLFFPTLLGAFFLSMPLYINDGSQWLGFAVGVLILVPCISGARTRFKLTHCVITGYKQSRVKFDKGAAEFMISNDDKSRLFRT
jgi:hypothetical protein